jgi:hypothetical protein
VTIGHRDCPDHSDCPDDEGSRISDGGVADESEEETIVHGAVNGSQRIVIHRMDHVVIEDDPEFVGAAITINLAEELGNGASLRPLHRCLKVPKGR